MNLLFWATIVCTLLYDSIIHGALATEEVQAPSPRSLRGGGDDEEVVSQLYLPPRQKLRILTLGGSVTWGAALDNRQWAYPYLLKSLGGHVVHNLAIRATDAYFPSLCIQSLVAEAQLLNVEFDVIVLEYSLNGVSGLTTLVKRLQYRYPEAAFVYVHLVSLQMVAERVKVDEVLHTWQWKQPRRKWENYFTLRPKLLAFLDQIGAYVYKLPTNTETNWLFEPVSFFGPDGHHLSEKGHAQVAADLLRVLSRAHWRTDQVAPTSQNHAQMLHTWGEGDSCSDWILSKHLSNPNVLLVSISDQVDGHTTAPVMRQMMGGDRSNHHKPSGKFALEFQTAGTISVINTKNRPLALYVSFMAGNAAAGYDDWRYPLTRITNHGRSFLVDPSGHLSDGRENIHHVRDTIQIGMAQPGLNIITIEPMDRVEEEKTGTNNDNNNDLPFRMVGVALYGFSYNVGLPLLKPHNSLLTTTTAVDHDEDKTRL